MNNTFSNQYFNILKRSQEFHNKSINWSGDGSYQYIDHLRKIISNQKCRTMLDYGCGKGDQYTDDERTDFSKLIGIDNYTLYDPAYSKFSKLPSGTWDIVICLDVLPFIPEEDISKVRDLMLSVANKLVVVGMGINSTKINYKSKKPFACIKTIEWWENILKHEKIKIVWIDPGKPFDRKEFLQSCVFESSSS